MGEALMIDSDKIILSEQNCDLLWEIISDNVMQYFCLDWAY